VNQTIAYNIRIFSRIETMAKINWQLALSDYLANEMLSYASIAQKYGVSLQAVKKRASKDGWVNLRKETIQKVDQKLSENISNKLVDVNLRHAKLGRLMQERGMKKMESGNFKIKSYYQALKIAMMGIEIERKAVGADK